MTEQLLRAQADIFRLPMPKTGEAVYFDEGKPRDRAPGLALRIRAAGSRKFVFFYRLGDASSNTRLAMPGAGHWTRPAWPPAVSA